MTQVGQAVFALIAFLITLVALAGVAWVFLWPQSSITKLPLAPFDGKGPAVNYIPVSLRPWVNRFYVRHGWPAPFDADLNKIPRKFR